MEVLVTGGAGYIGSTVASAAADRGWTPVVLDDLSRGRVEFVAGRAFHHGDIADGALVDRVFTEHPGIAATVHCAARIVVPESVRDPLGYYGTNVTKTLALLGHLRRNGCDRFVFSSSAAVYQGGSGRGVTEDAVLAPQSPYAASKWFVERILADAAAAGLLRAVSLRYFNPVGADPRLRTGPQDPAPGHALGRLVQAYERGEEFTVNGVDWPTRDGTPIRDYVHVWDLALAHLAVVERFDELCPTGSSALTLNLGTGRGTTVRELVEAFRAVADGPLAVSEGGRRPGDVAGCYALADRARELLGWSARLTLADAVRDALAWSRLRPERLPD